MSDVAQPRSVSDERDLSQLAEVFSAAFAAPVENFQPRLEVRGIENLRVIDVDGRVGGGLLSLPMGQYFGGRRVSSAGIALVGVAPHCRGKGLAGRLMRGILRDCRDQGMALSVLYPASVSLYRRFGYELAGSRFVASMNPADISVAETDSDIRPIGPEDATTVADLYAKWATQRDGCLDRNQYIWQRVRQHREGTTRGFLAFDGGEPAGYLYYAQSHSPTAHYQKLTLTDLVYTTPTAARQLMTFLAQHRTLVDRIDWPVGPNEPLLSLLAEKTFTQTLDLNWMIRVLDVDAALSRRGYGPHVTQRVELDIRDALLPENQGRFVLEVEAGRGRVRSGGDGTLKLDARALAAMYTGFLSPVQLAAIGWLSGTPDGVAQAQQVFSGPHPWMPDIF